jgi:HlyD family secretion protein
MNKQIMQWIKILIGIAATVIIIIVGWRSYSSKGNNSNIISSNGRIEAVEIDLATKIPGRIKEILVKEGEFITEGQILAVMDTEVLQAQLRQSEAQLNQTRIAVATAQSQLAQRESEKAAATASMARQNAELVKAKQHAKRSSELVSGGAIARQDAEDDAAQLKSAEAAVYAAKAQITASEAAITMAKTQIEAAHAAVEAARANVEQIKADIQDSNLTAPRDGRVQYLTARQGEVLGAGGRVLSMVDLSDVYMTFFLPTTIAGKLELGSEVRLVLDAATEYVIPATISFVADVAQFTPKTVETAEEREKLMFRVRARIEPALLKKYITKVKTGLPGMAHIKLDPDTSWPDNLQTNLVK